MSNQKFDHQLEVPVLTEGDEPCSIVATRFGRHPCDPNIIIDVPKFGAQAALSMSPAVYMNPEYLDNFLYYTVVVTSKEPLDRVRLAEIAVVAADFVGLQHLFSDVEEDSPTARVVVIYTPGYPAKSTGDAELPYADAVMLVVECDPAYFQQAVKIIRMAGMAAMAAGKLYDSANDSTNDVASNIVGRRLSDGMPPSGTKH